jgi:hypothetical protein
MDPVEAADRIQEAAEAARAADARFLAPSRPLFWLGLRLGALATLLMFNGFFLVFDLPVALGILASRHEAGMLARPTRGVAAATRP